MWSKVRCTYLSSHHNPHPQPDPDLHPDPHPPSSPVLSLQCCFACFFPFSLQTFILVPPLLRAETEESEPPLPILRVFNHVGACVCSDHPVHMLSICKGSFDQNDSGDGGGGDDDDDDCWHGRSP